MQKKRNIIPLVETYNEVDTEKYIKSYMFIKGFAVAKNLKQTLIALAVARHFHNGQYRKDGMPYIVHPLKVCSTLINYGIDDDTTLAAALLHDLLEDCRSSRYIRYRMYPSQNSGRAAFPHPALYETHYSTIIRKY